MKKSLSILMMAAVVAGSSLTACSSKPAETTAAETTAEAPESTENEASETEINEAEAEENEAEEAAAEEETLSEEELTDLYRDFGEALQNVIADKDMEEIAELMVYPSYIGIDDGIIVESEEDFLSLDGDKVFSDELIAAVESADLESIETVEAGFVVGDESGKPNVTFGLDEDGTMGIVGINY